jgi:sporulation-control protein spo0M
VTMSASNIVVSTNLSLSFDLTIPIDGPGQMGPINVTVTTGTEVATGMGLFTGYGC